MPEVKNEIIVHQPDATIRLEVRLENDTMWLTQEQMCILFQRDQSVITQDISRILLKKEKSMCRILCKFCIIFGVVAP